MKPFLSRLPIDPFIVSIVAMAALATLLPITGRGVNLANGAATAAIGLIFFLQGARLEPAAALAGARHWRLHTVIFASTFGLFPLLGLAERALVPDLLTPPLWAGLLMLCV